MTVGIVISIAEKTYCINRIIYEDLTMRAYLYIPK